MNSFQRYSGLRVKRHNTSIMSSREPSLKPTNDRYSTKLNQKFREWEKFLA